MPYSQDPPKYISDSGLTFHQVTDITYYKSFSIDDFSLKDCIALSLDHSHLADLQYTASRDLEKLSDDKSFVFLSKLLHENQFVILLLCDEERIDKTYKIKDKADLSKIMSECFHTLHPRGALITKL